MLSPKRTIIIIPVLIVMIKTQTIGGSGGEIYLSIGYQVVLIIPRGCAIIIWQIC